MRVLLLRNADRDNDVDDPAALIFIFLSTIELVCDVTS